MTQWKLALARRLSFLMPFQGGKEQDKWVIFNELSPPRPCIEPVANDYEA